ncbi:hypothetical protein L1285_16725 [Pseudoalteromonas sp. DL2-H2.2]|uniref:hypothetical protein n=1 Tax=Pseudoalteromonas sp. DL2-H2.2 TaxID=2908889 RepID=UPI001F3CA273|nr:hypothetical protein [Pseudoalteromonas sp. DL2-H2.2]MCF2909966.1 hypothetical protein [Pseudoalteromonas sp. DL2-H2.2]
MTPEGKASEVVRLRATELGGRLFRNNVGVLVDARGIPVRYGLANESKKMNQSLKSSDFIGITPITITPDMVGKQIGVFTAIEAKAHGFKVREFGPKSREFAQQKFINLVTNLGGAAGFACNAEDVDGILKELIERLSR